MSVNHYYSYLIAIAIILTTSATITSAIGAAAAAAVEDDSIFPSLEHHQQDEREQHHISKRSIVANYKATGYIWRFGQDLPIYETANSTGDGDGDGGRVLFAVYDLFGMHPNIQQIADKLATMGKFRIVIPDFFRGGGWQLNDFPAADQNKFSEFLRRNASWENVARPDLTSLIQYYRAEKGTKQFGMFGFCWGGKVSVQSSQELNSDIIASALIHPAAVTTDEAYTVKTPMYLMPSNSEPDMTRFYEILVDKFGSDKVGHTRFTEMVHGFAGARGDFSRPEIQEAVEQVIAILNKFFNEQLTGGASGMVHGRHQNCMLVLGFALMMMATGGISRILQ